MINDFLSSFQNKNLAILTKSALEIRDSLAKPITSFNEICDLLMKDGVILILMDIISKEFSEHPKLQESASWTLCNFTSGDTIYVEYALNNDILKNLVEALDFGDGIFLDNVFLDCQTECLPKLLQSVYGHLPTLSGSQKKCEMQFFN